MSLPSLPRTSPSGQPTCPSVGPLDAEIVCIAESPAGHEIQRQEPLVGRAGRVFAQCLTAAGIARPALRLVNLVPAQAPGNEFARHTETDIAWGRQRLTEELAALTGPKVIVALGANPLQWLLGLYPITKWQSSLVPPRDDRLASDLYNAYWERLPLRGCVPPELVRQAAVVPAFHPAAVARQMPWHIWLVNALKRASRYVSGNDFDRPQREWLLESPPHMVDDFVDRLIANERLVAIDTEMDPLVTALVGKREVHVFTWRDEYRPALAKLMRSPRVVKLAHNMQHDWRQFEKIYDVPVRPPWFDTIAGAHLLEPGGSSPGDRDRLVGGGEQQVGKSLSPHIATRFTGWPYHKWLVDTDMLTYCGMDTVVSYDAYWPQMEALHARPQLAAIAERDHQLFEVLFRATSEGLLVDEAARDDVQRDLAREVAAEKEALEALARPHIDAAIDRLAKPHLFRKHGKCKCCRGASKKMHRCWSCAGFESAPSKRALVEYAAEHFPELDTSVKKAELEELLLGECEVCEGAGDHVEDLPLNLDSSDQVADLLYRALGIPARRYEGRETVRFEQLARLLEDDGYLSPRHTHRRDARQIVELYIALAEKRTDLATVTRLEPGEDGRIRTVFDLWYTPTHRVASRESLLDKGSNLQNIPKAARRFIVPDPGEVFIDIDYAQIEGRNMAVLSRDETLLGIYERGEDSHMAVVRLLAEQGVEITRDQAKRVSYAAFYGIKPSHLADILGISQQLAIRALTAFSRAFPGAMRYRSQVERSLRQSRSVTTPNGWTRRWLGYVLEQRGRRQGEVKDKVLKEALATAPQEMAAAVLEDGILNVAKGIPWVRVKLHVHDSALVAVPTERLAEAIPLVENALCVTKWGMEYPAEAVCGPNWYVAGLDDDAPDKQDGGKWAGWRRDAVLANGAPVAG